MVKPRPSKFIPVANRVAKGASKLVDKGFNAFTKQNRGVTQYWQTSSSLWGGLQSLGLNCATISMCTRSMRRNNLNYQHYVTYGRYPNILIRGLRWLRDVVILYPLDVLWAYLEPILYSIFCGLLTLGLIILGNVLFFGFLYLLLTTKSS